MSKLSNDLKCEIVELLANNAADANMNDFECLADLFTTGVKGYNDYSDDELLEELRYLEEDDLLARAEAELGIDEMINSPNPFTEPEAGC